MAFPYKEMAVVFFLVICEQFAAEMLFPFAAFMVEDFNLTTAQKKWLLCWYIKFILWIYSIF